MVFYVKKFLRQVLILIDLLFRKYFGFILAPKPTTKKTTKRTTTTSTTTSSMSTTKAPVPCIMHGCTRCMTVNNNLASINNRVCFALVKSKSSSHIKNPIEKVKSICIANDGILPPNSFYNGPPPMTIDFFYLVQKNFPNLKKRCERW